MKRPILYVAVFFCTGIALSRFFKIQTVTIPSLASAVFLITTISNSKKRIVSHISLYLALLFFGIAYYTNSIILPPEHISSYLSDEPKEILVKGVIVSDPLSSTTFYETQKNSFLLKADACRKDFGWRKATGLVKVDVYSDNTKTMNFGDVVILKGFISKVNCLKNPGGFNYANYLKIKEIYCFLKVKDGIVDVLAEGELSRFKGLAYSLRHRIRDSLDRYLDAEHSGFIKTILIGDRSALEYGIKEDFIKTGTVHILAISGLHVGLIATLILWLFSILRLPKKLNLILTLIFLIFYSFVAGSNPPVIRAVIMFFMFAAGYLINRDSDTLNTLSLAAFLILLWNPKELFDPSFQLSFASVGSIIILMPKIDKALGLDFIQQKSLLAKMKVYIFKCTSVSIAAWLGTSPLISIYFSTVSPVAILANLIVIPMLFLLISVSFLFFLVALASSLLASLVGQALCAIEDILFFLNHIFSGLPFAYLRIGSMSAGSLALYYAFISLWCLPDVMDFERTRIRKIQALLALLLVFNILVWEGYINSGNGYLKILFFDVGQGDSIFIEFPKKGNMLIDAGAGAEGGKLDAGKSVIAPYLWSRGINKIDLVLISHFHEDHFGGIIYILKNFKVGCVMDNGDAANGTKIYDAYAKVLKERKIRHITVTDGDLISGFPNAKLFILNPQEELISCPSSKMQPTHGLFARSGGPRSTVDQITGNDNSIVLKLVYKNFSALFCGDITYKAIKRLNSYGEFLRSDVIKIPHHGGRLGDEKTVEDFFRKVSAQISVTSAGNITNFRNRPQKTSDIMAFLNYNTKQNGAISISVGPRSNVVETSEEQKN